jgi:hypothetical protein
MFSRRIFGMAAAALLCPGARAADVPAVDADTLVREQAQRAGQTLRLLVPDPGSLSIHPMAAACLRLPTQEDLHLLFTNDLIGRWTQGGYDKLRGASVQITVRVREGRFGKNVLADVLDFSRAG